MKFIRGLGFVIVLFSIILNFDTNILGFSIIETTKSFSSIFIIFLFLGITLIIVGGDVSGGLEKYLKDDVIGVISFVRHGEKGEEGEEIKKGLTEKGREQARALGKRFKKIYDTKNEGNIYLAASSSPIGRTIETVKLILGVEPRYNKSIIKDDRLVMELNPRIMNRYAKIFKEEGREKANDWYLTTKNSRDVAYNLASFLESNKKKFMYLNRKGKRFQYIAGTHEVVPESLLKRILVKEGKRGFNKISEIGGGLNYAEPINFLLKKDGTYQVNFRDKIYDVDMDELERLSSKHKK